MTSFSDDFNRANGAPGANWVDATGLWTIVSNQLSPGTAGGTIVIRAATAMATNDHSAQITIAGTGAVSHGVTCRGNTGFTSGYLWRNDGTSWVLFSNVGGSFTSLGSYAAAAVAGDIAKIQAVGSTITGYVNGIARVTVTNTAVTTGTSVGLRAESSSLLRFDDFSAGDVTAGATLGIASSTETAQPLTATKTAPLGIAAETGSAQILAGAKTAAPTFASASETAQPLTGGKTAAITPAASTDTAQPLTCAKTAPLAFATTPEVAQALAGTKTVPLGGAASIETAQPLTGGKTAALGTALETAAAQTLTGTKAALLPGAADTETAQPLAGATNQSLTVAASVETAQPLTGIKSATLDPAVEVNTARPLVTAGPDVDIDVTVGQPYSPWTVGEPQGASWPTSQPQPDAWLIGQPQ